MTTGPDDGRRPPEPTFADVMNGFSFDSGRKTKRRRWGRRREEEPVEQAAPQPDAGPTGHQEESRADTGEIPVDASNFDERYQSDNGSTSVRPYTWTRGRTRTGYQLEIETLVATTPRGQDQMALLQVEHRSVAELCESARSVAEVAALLRVPLGVARVLVGDMAGLGLVAVHQSVSSNGDVPDLALMERVLSGLRRL